MKSVTYNDSINYKVPTIFYSLNFFSDGLLLMKMEGTNAPRANILQTGASLVLATCSSVFAHLKLPFTVYTSAIILISQSIGKLLFSCVTQLVSNKKVEVIRLKTIQMQINFAFTYSTSCKSEIKSTALESESERGKQCFAGFRGGNKWQIPTQPNPTRTKIFWGKLFGWIPTLSLGW